MSICEHSFSSGRSLPTTTHVRVASAQTVTVSAWRLYPYSSQPFPSSCPSRTHCDLVSISVVPADYCQVYQWISCYSINRQVSLLSFVIFSPAFNRVDLCPIPVFHNSVLVWFPPYLLCFLCSLILLYILISLRISLQPLLLASYSVSWLPYDHHYASNLQIYISSSCLSSELKNNMLSCLLDISPYTTSTSKSTHLKLNSWSDSQIIFLQSPLSLGIAPPTVTNQKLQGQSFSFFVHNIPINVKNHWFNFLSISRTTQSFPHLLQPLKSKPTFSFSWNTAKAIFHLYPFSIHSPYYNLSDLLKHKSNNIAPLCEIL